MAYLLASGVNDGNGAVFQQAALSASKLIGKASVVVHHSGVAAIFACMAKGPVQAASGAGSCCCSATGGLTISMPLDNTNTWQA